MANHPLHPHPLHLSDPLSLYAEYQGEWKCDNCEITYNRTYKPYHCENCSYDLCETCFQAKQHPRHKHNLYLTNMNIIYPQYGGEWKCDACQGSKGPPLEPMAYHCFQDGFDLCKDCFQGRTFSIHQHPLLPVDASIVYRNNSTGKWNCDGCTDNKTGTYHPWHCFQCEFDFCNQCLKEVKITRHSHPLKLTDSHILYSGFDGCWQCDLCSQNFNPKVDHQIPFHCHKCQFDACRKCVNKENKLEGDMPCEWKHINSGSNTKGPTLNTGHHPPEEK